MLVAQNSLGSVCPVPLTVRGIRRGKEAQAFGAPRSNVDLERGFLDNVFGLPLVEDRFRADRLVGRVRDEGRRHGFLRVRLRPVSPKVLLFLDRTEGH